jgi:two-component system response regulator RegA
MLIALKQFPESPDESFSSLPAPRFLVVDDDPICSRVLTRSLRARGFDVAFAGNPADALTIAGEWKPDYIITELKVTGESMLPMIRLLKAQSPRARICIVTHLAGIAAAVEAIKLGAWYYLVKPVTTDEILLRLGVASCRSDDVGSESEMVGCTIERPVAARTYALDDIEWRHIMHALRDSNGNIAEAARRLRMHRRTLHRKLSAHGQELVTPLLERLRREGRASGVKRSVRTAPGEKAFSASVARTVAAAAGPVLQAA